MRFAPLSLSSSLRPFPRSLLLPALLLLAACRGSEWSAADTSGSEPRLPEPNAGLLPVVNPARAVGWAEDAAPVPAEALAVQAFARGLQHPRWLYVLPNGDVLVAESNAQPGQAASNRLLSWAMDRVKALMGAATPSADRITLLRDADGDGHAELRTPFLTGLRSPFGMTLVGDSLYVANTDALLRFPYTPGTTRLESAGEQVLPLPAVPFNYHWTKNVVAAPDGSRLYLTVGSNSNIAENGLERETGRALVLEFDPASGRAEVFASGLRNPNGLAWEPETGALWTVVNERDGLGHDLPPDYLTALQRGGFYGWPWSYWGSIVDERVQPQRPERVAEALVPDYALGAHTAPLGLAFAQGTALPQSFRNGAFIALHGSWNRRPASGYELIFVPFRDGRPTGPPRTVLSGFLNADGRAQGRPVGVVLDAHGAVLLADDVGDTVWRVTAAP